MIFNKILFESKTKFILFFIIIIFTVYFMGEVYGSFAPASHADDNVEIRIHNIVGFRSKSIQTILLYPSRGCGSYLGLRVESPEGERIYIINARNWSIDSFAPFPFNPATMGAFRGLEICDGKAYLMTMRPLNKEEYTLGHNVTLDFATIIYRVDKKGVHVLANTSLYAASMLAEKDYIILLGVNGTSLHYDLFNKQWWHPVIEIRDYSGNLLAREVLAWNVSNAVLGGVMINTRLIGLGRGWFLAIFYSEAGLGNVSDEPRRMLLGLFRVENRSVKPIRLFVFPAVGNIEHALLHEGRLYVLYMALAEWPKFYPKVYVYDVGSGELLATYSSENVAMKSGCLVLYKDRVYVVVFVPLLASGNLLPGGLLPKPSAAAAVTLHPVTPGLPVVAQQRVKINGYVDWDFIEHNHQVYDIDGNGRPDVAGEAFSVSLFGGEAGKVYLVDLEISERK